jgi:hypothetical protein
MHARMGGRPIEAISMAMARASVEWPQGGVDDLRTVHGSRDDGSLEWAACRQVYAGLDPAGFDVVPLWTAARMAIPWDLSQRRIIH